MRAKFRVESKDGIDGGTIKLRAVTSGSPENDEFFNATPAGYMHLETVNKEAFDEFAVGQEVYLEFTPAVILSASEEGEVLIPEENEQA